MVILREAPKATNPGREIAVNPDWVVAVTPNEHLENTCFITVDGDGTPRYMVQGNFYEVVRKLTKP